MAVSTAARHRRVRAPADSARHAGRAGAALLTGLVTPLAFAPYGWWPLAILAPALLLSLIVGLRWRAAAVIGWCFGLGMFGHGVWWIQVSVHQFGIPYYAFSVSMTALFVAAMALYPALYAALLAALAARLSPARVWLLAAPLWVLGEALRGWLFTGFPWLSLGYSQIDGPLAGFAPVLGVGGASLAVMAIAALIARSVRMRGRGLPVCVALSALLLAAGSALGRVEFTHVLARDLQAALVQGAVPQQLKWAPEERARSIALYMELTEPHWAADVVIWPETAITAFPHEVPETIEALSRRAREADTALLVGMPSGEPWRGRYYNSLLGFGNAHGRYDKRHLVPFGEFFPLEDLLGGLARRLRIPMSDFSAGAPSDATLEVGPYLAGASICYEDAFAREVLAALPAAAFLVNVSNDAWFGDTIAPHQHLEIARMRALESGRYLLRGTNSGITAVIDERGRIAGRAEQFRPAVLSAAFQARGGATPYVRMGAAPVNALLGLVVLISAWPALRRGARGGAR